MLAGTDKKLRGFDCLFDKYPLYPLGSQILPLWIPPHLLLIVRPMRRINILPIMSPLPLLHLYARLFVKFCSDTINASSHNGSAGNSGLFQQQ
jgi:hypothetical protein